MPPVDEIEAAIVEIEAAIVEVAEANPTDGYRLVREWVCRALGRQVNRKRVLRVMRRAQADPAAHARAAAPTARVLHGRAPRAALGDYPLGVGTMVTHGKQDVFLNDETYKVVGWRLEVVILRNTRTGQEIERSLMVDLNDGTLRLEGTNHG